MPRVASLHYHTIGNKIWKKTPSSKNMTTKSFSTKTDDLEKSLQLNFSRKNKIRVWKKSLFFEFEAESSKLLLAMDSGKERVSLNAASEERTKVGDEPLRPRRGWVLGSGKIPETNRIDENNRYEFNKRSPGYSKYRSCITQAERTLCSGSGTTNDLFKSIG